MGCDIHLYIESRAKERCPIVIEVPDPTKEGHVEKVEIDRMGDAWHPCFFTGNARKEFSDRVYGMFAKLSNVRNYWNVKPIELRGFPSDASDTVRRAYCTECVPDAEFDEEMYERLSDVFGYTFCKESDVENQIKIGQSKVMYEKNGRKYTSCVDYHSPNWCTTQELEECINEVFFNKKEMGDFLKEVSYDKELTQHLLNAMEWTNLLAIMKNIESTGYYECRAVYWFDN